MAKDLGEQTYEMCGLEMRKKLRMNMKLGEGKEGR